QRVHAGDDCDGAALAALVIAPHQDVPVLALGNHHGRDAWIVVHLHPVGAVVDPARIGILHDHHAAGADVRSAVVLVPFGRGYLREVDVLAGRDVLEYRTGFDRDGRNPFRTVQVCAPVVDEIHLRGVGGHAERERDLLDPHHDVRGDPVAAGIAGDVVEEQ